MAENDIIATQLPDTVAPTFYQQMIQAAWTPSAPAQIDKRYLLQLYWHLSDTMADYKAKQNKELTTERVQTLKRQVELNAAQKKFMSALEETAGKNSRVAVQEMTDALTSLYKNMTYLAKTNNEVIEEIVDRARSVFDQTQDKTEALSAAFGDLESKNLLMSGSVELPMIMQKLEEQFAPGNPPSFDNIPNSVLRQRALEYKGRAEQQKSQYAIARRWMEDSYNNLNSIAQKFAAGIDPVTGKVAALPALIAEAQATDKTITQAIDKSFAQPTDIAQLQLSTFMKEDAEYNRMGEDLDIIRKKLWAADSSAETYRESMARIVATPKFQAWAKDNGFTVGNAEVSEDGTVLSYVPGHDDEKAMMFISWQVRHPDPLIRDHNTREWVKVERTVPGTDHEVMVNPLANGKYAYVEDDEGKKQYLDQTQMNAYAEAKGASRYYTAVAENQGISVVLLRDALTGMVYSDNGQGGWTEAPEAAAYATGWTPAAVANPDGSYRLMEEADFPTSSIKNVVMLDDEDIKKMPNWPPPDVNDVVKYADKPTATPTTETVYGKRIRMHATDPLGSVRVLTDTGEVLIPPEEIVNKEVTVKGTGVTFREAMKQKRGQVAAEISKRADDTAASPLMKPTINDKIAAPTVDHVAYTAEKNPLEMQGKEAKVPAPEFTGEKLDYTGDSDKQRAEIDKLLGKEASPASPTPAVTSDDKTSKPKVSSITARPEFQAIDEELKRRWNDKFKKAEDKLTAETAGINSDVSTLSPPRTAAAKTSSTSETSQVKTDTVALDEFKKKLAKRIADKQAAMTAGVNSGPNAGTGSKPEY